LKTIRENQRYEGKRKEKGLWHVINELLLITISNVSKMYSFIFSTKWEMTSVWYSFKKETFSADFNYYESPQNKMSYSV